jgi:hypothetical protein
MANEIKITIKFDFKNGNAAFPVERLDKKYDAVAAAQRFVAGKQNVGFAAEEAIDVQEITNLGWAYFENLDDTDFVELRPATGVADFAKLKTLEIGTIRLAADAVPFAQADTSTVDLLYCICED